MVVDENEEKGGGKVLYIGWTGRLKALSLSMEEK